MKRGRWFWLLVPAVGVGVAFSASPSDEFAEFSREGTPVALKAVTAALQDPFYGKLGTVSVRPGERTRAWRLPLPAADYRRRVEARGFARTMSSSVVDTTAAGKRFVSEITDLTNSGAGTRLTLVAGTTLPKGVGCFAVAHEATGLGVAWRRFAARVGRVFGR